MSETSPCFPASSSDSTVRRPGYSFTWAEHVVNLLTQKHARGVNAFKRVFEVNDRQLACFLARGDPIWPQIRDIIHLMENWEKKGCSWDIYSTDVKLLRQHLHRTQRLRLLGRLDKVQNSAKNERAGKQGEGGGP